MIELGTGIAALAAAAVAGWLARRAALRRGEDDASELRRRAEQLEQRLQQSDAQRILLETVIAAMGEGVLVVGSTGRVLLANPRLRELFSAPAALEGRSLLEAVRHAEVVDAIESAVSEGARAGSRGHARTGARAPASLQRGAVPVARRARRARSPCFTT